jgi:hypothetical protein
LIAACSIENDGSSPTCVSGAIRSLAQLCMKSCSSYADSPNQTPLCDPSVKCTTCFGTSSTKCISSQNEAACSDTPFTGYLASNVFCSRALEMSITQCSRNDDYRDEASSCMTSGARAGSCVPSGVKTYASGDTRCALSPTNKAICSASNSCINACSGSSNNCPSTVPVCTTSGLCTGCAANADCNRFSATPFCDIKTMACVSTIPCTVQSQTPSHCASVVPNAACSTTTGTGNCPWKCAVNCDC